MAAVWYGHKKWHHFQTTIGVVLFLALQSRHHFGQILQHSRAWTIVPYVVVRQMNKTCFWRKIAPEMRGGLINQLPPECVCQVDTLMVSMYCKWFNLICIVPSKFPKISRNKLTHSNHCKCLQAAGPVHTNNRPSPRMQTVLTPRCFSLFTIEIPTRWTYTISTSMNKNELREMACLDGMMVTTKLMNKKLFAICTTWLSLQHDSSIAINRKTHGKSSCQSSTTQLQRLAAAKTVSINKSMLGMCCRRLRCPGVGRAARYGNGLDRMR